MYDILISIIVPVYNGEKYLKDCLDSILVQSYKSIEIIVVDDGSTDNSEFIISDYVSSDTRVNYYKRDHMGLPHTRKFGVDCATGDYVIFVDCDDYLEKDAVKYIVEKCREYKVDIVSYLYCCNNRNSIPDGLYSHDELKKYWRKLIFDMEAGIPGLNQSLCTKAFRRNLLSKAFSEIDSRITLGEDAAATYIAVLMADTIYISSKRLYCYRTNDESMCHVENVKQFEEIYIFQQYMRNKLSIYDERYCFDAQLKAYICVLLLIPIRNCFAINMIANTVLPKKCLENGINIILFGAGTIGREYYDKLIELGCNIVAWIDSGKAGETINNRLIESPENILSYSYDSVIIAIKDKHYIDEVVSYLYSKNISKEKIYTMEDNNGATKWSGLQLKI